MENTALQQYYRTLEEDKQKIDTYSVLLDDTVRNVKNMSLRGRSRAMYLETVYQEQKKICPDVPKWRFFADVNMKAGKQ